jgi:hypothetical protein
MSSNNVRHFITRTITTLHHTSPNYTSLHLPTLHFLSFTLHYPLIWLNPCTFPTVLFHLASLDTVQSSHIQTYFQNNEPLHCPKEPLTISLHFTFYLFIYFFFYVSHQSFTSLYCAIHIYNSLPFTSCPFTVYFLSPSLPLTGLTMSDTKLLKHKVLWPNMFQLTNTVLNYYTKNQYIYVNGRFCILFNHLTPNGHFSGRTALLTYRCCIFYLFNRYTYWIF